MRDEAFLAQKAALANQIDLSIAQNLLDTLAAHKDGCVGMAANMIGINKRIIAFDNEGSYMVMFNPEVVKRSGPYEAKEGCLSLAGIRKAKRWKSVKVQRTRTRISKPVSRPSLVGQPRLFSMRSTTVKKY